MPTLPWWTTASHDKTIAFVKRRYGGNWNRYIAAWQNRLEELSDALANQRTVVLPGADLRLHGRGLAGYIGKVVQRLAVVRCLARVRSDLARPGDPAHGRNVAARNGCFACHGESGRALLPDAPHIAAQKVWYLRGQLWTFAAAKDAMPSSQMPQRSHAAMNFAAHRLAPQDIADVAAYFAAQPCVEPTPPIAGFPPPQSERCIHCHGADGISGKPEIPNLAGQKTAYLERQLSSFGRDPPVHQLAGDGPLRYHFSMRRMADVDGIDIIALANYFATQACP